MLIWAVPEVTEAFCNRSVIVRSPSARIVSLLMIWTGLGELNVLCLIREPVTTTSAELSLGVVVGALAIGVAGTVVVVVVVVELVCAWTAKAGTSAAASAVPKNSSLRSPGVRIDMRVPFSCAIRAITLV